MTGLYHIEHCTNIAPIRSAEARSRARGPGCPQPGPRPQGTDTAPDHGSAHRHREPTGPETTPSDPTQSTQHPPGDLPRWPRRAQASSHPTRGVRAALPTSPTTSHGAAGPRRQELRLASEASPAPREHSGSLPDLERRPSPRAEGSARERTRHRHRAAARGHQLKSTTHLHTHSSHPALGGHTASAYGATSPCRAASPCRST